MWSCLARHVHKGVQVILAQRRKMLIKTCQSAVWRFLASRRLLVCRWPSNALWRQEIRCHNVRSRSSIIPHSWQCQYPFSRWTRRGRYHTQRSPSGRKRICCLATTRVWLISTHETEDFCSSTSRCSSSQELESFFNDKSAKTHDMEQ